tara:strand:- start:4081 stop:4536 length:456 start_codon:yes stop_codon:yes gene_type:complete
MANTFTYLEGTMFFPFIFDKMDKFDRFSMALGLEGDQVKNAKNIGLIVKQDDNKMDGMAYVQLKSNYKPLLFDAEGNDYGGPTMLSNGSKAVVKVSQRPYNNSFGTGTTTFMNAVKITDPVEYVPEGGKSKGFDDKPKAGAVDDLNDEVPF